MVIVKCVKNYQDLKLNRRVTVGEQFEVSNDRAKELMNAKVAEATTPTPEEVVKAPKKSKAKKEA